MEVTIQKQLTKYMEERQSLNAIQHTTEKPVLNRTWT
jgi:hypothetical protein